MFTSLRWYLVCAILCISATSTSAQEFLCWNSNASPADTISVLDTILGPGQTHLEKVTNSYGGIWDVIVMNTSTSGKSLYIPVESVGFYGNGVDSVNSRTTGEIFSRIGLVSLKEALLKGAISPPPPGSSMFITVTVIGCVNRSGTGASTSFTACTYPGGCCRREYLLSTPGGGGIPTITFVSSNGPYCSGSCESTCGDGNGLLSLLGY